MPRSRRANSLFSHSNSGEQESLLGEQDRCSSERNGASIGVASQHPHDSNLLSVNSVELGSNLSPEKGNGPFLSGKGASGHERSSKIRQSLGFNLTFASNLIKLSTIINKESLTLVLLLSLFIGAVGLTWVVSLTADVTGGFYQAIFKKDRNEFFNVLWLSSLVVLGSAILSAFNLLLQEALAWRWRRSLTLYVHHRYFWQHLFYKVVQQSSDRIDNPDQRITQDVNNFANSLSTTLFNCISAPAILIYYTYKTATFIIWFAPLLVAVYFFLGYLINKLIMTPIVRLVFEQEKLEGDFRTDHMRIRDCSESIAIYNGQDIERQFTEKTFKRVLKNKLRLLLWQFPLNTSSNSFSYLGAVINYVIVAIPTLFMDEYADQETVDPKFIAKASFYCIMLISGFSQFINISQSLSDLAGYTARVSELLAVISELKQLAPFQQEPEEEGDSINFENVSCFSPIGEKLAHQLNFSVSQGQNLLIQGSSGCGKSTILRCLSGLSPFFEGRISRPPSPEFGRPAIFYLPQIPYLLPYGTLVDQIVYPKDLVLERSSSDQQETALTLLQTVGLQILVSRFGLEQTADWPKVLSPGQQQLLSFARLLYHSPHFAVLDESTSSLPESTECNLYSLCQKQKITLLSVGHRKSLQQYHHFILQYRDDMKEWDLSPNPSLPLNKN